MSKRSTLNISKRSLHNQEQSLDKMPHKSIKKHKAKERQQGKKLAQPEPWYCNNCAVAVHDRRCVHCGKLEKDKS